MSDSDSENCQAISEWPPPDGEEEEDENSTEIDQNFDQQPRKKPRLVCNFQTADKALVVWLRRNLHLKEKYSLVGVKNPKTVLNVVSDTKEGRHFLMDHLNEIQSNEDLYELDPKYFYVVATYCDRLHHVDKAHSFILECLKLHNLEPSKLFSLPVHQYLDEISKLEEDQEDALWLHSKLEMEKSLKEKAGENCLKREVLNLDYTKVSAESFRSHCKSKTPIVFNNVPNPCKNVWTKEFLKQTIGKCKFEVKRPVTGSTEWAGLETEGLKTVSEFLTSLETKSENQSNQENKDYLFDWSLLLHAPELSKDFTVPELMCDNYLKLTDPSCMYHSSWPSLFIAGAGTNSGLHIDAFSSHFWMFLISGEKRWTFYPPEAAGLLGPRQG